MADSAGEEHTDLNKMKVPDLKKMLKARGLSVNGNKQELIDRLQSSEAAAEALLEGSEVGDIIDEELDRELDETLDDEPVKEVEETSPLKEEEKIAVDTPPEPAKVEAAVTSEGEKEVAKADEKDKLKNGTSAEAEKPQPKHKRITIGDATVVDDTDDMAARKKARLERFNQTTESKEGAEDKTSTADSLAKRAARFSSESDKTGATSTIINDPLSNKNKVEITTKTDNGTDKMKKRAERFGILSPAEQKKQQLEKLQARKARFASTATTAPAAAAPTPAAEKTSAAPLPAVKTASSLDEKKRLRAERFKIKS
ncbi:hypothetical protein GE061_007698 [Apolygus lucorum]|uniref:Uncharacterized protein n=1 Tax=Apolygus lucorum TaxID=248454 RepID=A0A6A4IT67_APOLU|nr:hypothetical protein GE061_007698 [Apolygus lucorum]